MLHVSQHIHAFRIIDVQSPLPADAGAMTSPNIGRRAASQEGYDSLATSHVEPDDKSEVSPLEDLELVADTMKGLQVPRHPIPAMQGAFAESMVEASVAATSPVPKPNNSSASARRRELLDQGIQEDTHASKWRQKPGQRYHELWKLMAQISFGIYLLLNGIAKDDEQVLNILQGHVDEVDGFLEATLEDFDLAIEDIDERLRFLKTPLENIELFDQMLEDRQFRLQIITGNERIEHIIHRTASAMNDALKDVKQGLDATKEFAIYLASAQETGDWKEARPDMQKVFDAMKGNAEGWYKAYVTLQTKGNYLGQGLVQLGAIVAEMNKRAGEVSRKTRVCIFHAYTSLYTNVPQFSITPGESPILQTTSNSSSAPRKAPSHHTQSSHASSNAPRKAPSHYTQSSRNLSTEQLRKAPSHQTQASLHSVTLSNKDLPTDGNMITPAIRATLPAFQYVSDREIDPEAEAEALQYKAPVLEPKINPESLVLEPRTYSPKPQSTSPQPSTQHNGSSTPDIPPMAAGRKRVSLKRKAAQDIKMVTMPLTSSHAQAHASPQPKTVQVRSSPTARYPPDSAYGSDTDKTNTQSHSISHHFESQRDDSRTRSPSDYARSVASPQLPQTFGSNYVASPRSDQQHFHPVLASPHSPLQRPWTAAPTNLRSTTSLSNMSHMTSVTENGKQVKKKRSGFGWLKKAFSLSEEERAVFESKRTGQVANHYAAERRPQFLDGKRIR